MKDIVGNNKQNILLIIVIVLAGWNIFTTNGIKTDVNSYKKKIEGIQVKVDSAQVVNKEIDTKVMEVKENVTNITKEIHHIDNNLTIPNIVGDTLNAYSNDAGVIDSVSLSLGSSNASVTVSAIKRKVG